MATKTEDYKGYQLRIQEPTVNPNGRKTQTVMIYNGVNFVAGSYADILLEDAVGKAKKKIDLLIETGRWLYGKI